MYSSANEDGGKYNPADPEYNEQKREDKKRKAEEKKAKRAKVKHIKIRASQGLSGEESPSPLDDGNKRDDEREIGLQGGPAGSRGTLLDLATGAKSGTGSAMSPGLPIAMSEPMGDAWSSLLKQDPHVHDVGDGSDEDTQRYFDEEVRPEVMNPDTPRPYATMDNGVLDTQVQRMLEGILEYDEEILNEYNYRLVENDLNAQGSAVSDAGFHPTFQDIHRSEPMGDAWSSLLKQDEEPFSFNLNEVFESPNHEWYDQIMGTETPMIQNLVNSGMMDAMGYKNHHHGDAETLSGMHEENLHPQASMDMIMEHRNSLLVLDAMMQDKEHTVPQQFREQHQNADMTRMLSDMPPHAQVAANLASLYTNLNYLGHLIGPQMGEPDDDFSTKNASEPMKDAWSTLLKRETARSIAGRRRREARQQFRPSTGQFKTPPGGMSGGAGATMRRFKAQMRGIKSGKKTGLMKPHLSVEMSHRGIQTKQPLSKDPQKYTQYKGQSEARKILGNVRTPFSPHARYGARSNYAGPTGGGRLSGLMAGQSGQMARPALRRMRRPRMPRMPRMRAPMPPSPPMMPQVQSSVPAMPSPSSSIMMSEERYRSEILKARNSLHRIELLNLMRRLIQAKEREAKIKKNYTATDSAKVPGHPVGVKPTDDEDPQGPTENLETDAKTFGLDPVGIINSRRGQM
jgi:hypothetical protein